MFGLFKNKKEVKQDSPEYLELVEKWDAFLSKIETRFQESLVHAEEAVMDNLVESDFNIEPSMRAWNGIKSQLMGMMQKIEDTFEHKVEPQMLEYKEKWDVLDQDQKGIQLGESIYHRLERFERIVEGKISQRFYDHAIQLLNEDFHCCQCSGKLEIKKDIFRTHYVNCGYCNTVNTFTPNTKVAEIQGFAIANIAAYRAMDEWDAMQKAENDFGEIRTPSEDEDKTAYTAGFKNREVTERAYWTKFLTERFGFLPEYEETFEHDLDVKMRHFYEERKRELNF